MKYEKTFNVDISDADGNNNLRLDAFAKYLQETAAAHAESRGYSSERMEKLKLAWVLHTLYIKKEEVAKKGESLNVRTWSLGIEGAKGKREFEVLSGKKRIANATSLWVLIDTEKRRLSRADEEMIAAYPKVNEKKIDEEAEEIEIPEKGKNVFSFELGVRHSDFDTNTHVNNAAYFDYVDSAFFRYSKSTSSFNEILIKYKKEIKKESEHCIVSLFKSKDAYSFEIKSGDTLNAKGFFKIKA